nr:Cell division control protein 2 [Hymenolepis microstoma]
MAEVKKICKHLLKQVIQILQSTVKVVPLEEAWKKAIVIGLSNFAPYFSEPFTTASYSLEISELSPNEQSN